MPPRTTPPSNAGSLKADDADRLVEAALQMVPAWLASLETGNDERWQGALRAERAQLERTIAKCERLMARARDAAWARQLEEHTLRLRQLLDTPIEPLPSNEVHVTLRHFELGEVVGFQKSNKQPVHADLTLHVQWREVKSVARGGAIRDADPIQRLNHKSEDDLPSDAATWKIDPIAQAHVSADKHEEVWRFIVAPSEAGSLKVFARLQELMAAHGDALVLTHQRHPHYGVISPNSALCALASQQGYRTLHVDDAA